MPIGPFTGPRTLADLDNPGQGQQLYNTSAGQVNPNLMQFNELLPPSNKGTAKLFKFRINPSRLSVSRKKVEQFILTKFGYERQFWINSVWTFTYDGISGVFRPEQALGGGLDTFSVEKFDIRQSAAWTKFQEFENFFVGVGENNIQMNYWGYGFPFVGSMNDFDWTYDPSSNPKHISYKFKFTAFPVIQPLVQVTVNQRPASQDQASRTVAQGAPGDFPPPNTGNVV